MQYQVVRGRDTAIYSDAALHSCAKEEFEKAVNDEIKKGWVPAGNLVVIYIPNEYFCVNYFQAMVKN